MYIYALVYPDTKEPYYVGKSVNPDRRFEQHLSSSMHTLRLLNRQIIPELQILAHYSGDTDIDAMEFAWINRMLDRGYLLQNTALNPHFHFVSDDDYTVQFDNLYTVKCYAWDDSALRPNEELSNDPLTEMVVNEGFKPRGQTKRMRLEAQERKAFLVSRAAGKAAVEKLNIPGIK